MFIRKQQGFTLIELLIVVIIIGILAMLAIPRFMVSQQDAQKKTCHANAAMLSDAAERYYFSTGGYPASGTTISTTTPFIPNYLKEFPKCPAGATYSFTDATSGIATCSSHGTSTSS